MNASTLAVTTSELRIDTFNKRVLNLSFNWLNDPEIQKLIDSQPVSYESQQEWFARLTSRTDIVVRSIWHLQNPIGAMGLKHITGNEAEYWGYIGEKSYWGRNIGSWMIMEAIKLAQQKGLNRLYLQVLPTNERAIKLYQKTGFNLTENKSSQRLLRMERVITNKVQ